MKPSQGLLIVGIIVGLGALFVWGYRAASAPLPEGFPPPTAKGEIEIKQYPAYRAATVQVRGDLGKAASRGFSPLFRHISDNDISMTAPVETRYPTATLQTGTISDGDAAVSFLYRSLDVVPKEVAQNVRVEDILPMTVVSIGLRGGYGYGVYTRGVQQLQDWLTAHPEYEVVGPPRRFFYDGPFIPDGLKRSDIQIPVERN
ncbi:ABC transporter substrate-binding protein [Leptolyngbyaceae cyanobacterium CCMR0082]|uniref:ABC transporter substrate-binding protein n=2 Tax=Adonisia turfae TaxID=2950184 RepID=A0A6M0SB36_9CYAN|nr:heme-binding protein [Adonisia turfae]NEZ58641.1 ABC transporter substrate-binding protein [Adonisia turfae CCMR0081]NEZ65516.1 ABC transporter substrate-binding protein [Adonisia turfae CCMR0082]